MQVSKNATTYVAAAIALALVSFSGTTAAEPITGDAEVKLNTIIRKDGAAPKSISLNGKQAFVLRAYSTRSGDSLSVVFTKSNESFNLVVANAQQVSSVIDLITDPATPLRGPATVTISGTGLVSYEIQTLAP